MRLLLIEMENWKCFTRKIVRFSSVDNIINQRNGTGKTSLFEGIVFGLYGKRPPGLDFNDLRLDPYKDSLVKVEFEHEDNYGVSSQYVVTRRFGRTGSATVTKDGQTVATSVTEAFDLIDSIFPWSVASVLWSPSTLTSSRILDPKFIVDNVFEHVFKDARALEAHYKKEVLAQNKVVKNLKAKLTSGSFTVKDLEDVKKQISELKSSLKEKTTKNDYLITKARQAEAASKELTEFEEALSEAGVTEFRPVEKSVCEEYLSLTKGRDVGQFKSQLEKAVADELAKSDDVLTKVPVGVAKTLIQASVSDCQCALCKREASPEVFDVAKELVEKGKTDHTKVQKFEKALKLLELDKEHVEVSKKYHDLKSKVAECPEWQSVLSKYDEENQKAWGELERLQAREKSIEKSLRDQKEYLEEEKKLKELQDKLKVPQEYIEEAADYYLYTLTEKASDILRSLNGRYDNLFLDKDSFNYKVSVLSEDAGALNLLNVLNLSSGEKTLVGAALIFATCDVFFKDVPLLFDESFAALDVENVSSLKSYLKQRKQQVLIVTHNDAWSE